MWKEEPKWIHASRACSRRLNLIGATVWIIVAACLYRQWIQEAFQWGFIACALNVAILALHPHDRLANRTLKQWWNRRLSRASEGTELHGYRVNLEYYRQDEALGKEQGVLSLDNGELRFLGLRSQFQLPRNAIIDTSGDPFARQQRITIALPTRPLKEEPEPTSRVGRFASNSRSARETEEIRVYISAAFNLPNSLEPSTSKKDRNTPLPFGLDLAEFMNSPFEPTSAPDAIYPPTTPLPSAPVLNWIEAAKPLLLLPFAAIAFLWKFFSLVNVSEANWHAGLFFVLLVGYLAHELVSTRRLVKGSQALEERFDPIMSTVEAKTSEATAGAIHLAS